MISSQTYDLISAPALISWVIVIMKSLLNAYYLVGIMLNVVHVLSFLVLLLILKVLWESHIYRWENWGLKKLSDFFKFTQNVSAKIWSQELGS